MIPKRQSSPEQHQSVALSFPRDTVLGSRRLGAFKVRDLILVRSCLGAFLYRGIQSLFVRERGNVGVRFLLLILHEHHHA